jgi:hypothetical protein
VRAEPREESKFQWLARLGFIVRGLLYIIIAIMVIGTGRTEDLTGTIDYVGRGPGRSLLIILVAGLAGYGLWRLSDAAFGMDSGRHRPKAWRRRVAAAGSGAIYLFLSWKAFRIMLGSHESSSAPQQNAATALHLPGGPWMLGIAALVLGAAGLVQFYKAGSCSFLWHLDERARRPFAKWLGRFGYAARGVIFITVGVLLARAALDRSPAEAGGLEQALDALRGPLQYPVAIGLLLFGCYSLVEARYRSIHRPPVEQIKRNVQDQLSA